jgi:ABC-2 type transport system permease protein
MKYLNKLFDNLYMAWAIASKDIIEVLKNKSISASLAIMIVMILFSTWSNTRGLADHTDLAVYDPGESSLVAALSNDPDYRVRRTSTEEAMIEMMGVATLGLSIPEDFDARLENGEVPVVEGYLIWGSRDRQAEIIASFEQDAAGKLGNLVHLEIGDNIVRPGPESMGDTRSVAVVVMMWPIFLLALSIVPNLMAEEKQAKTMDALLVSPATTSQVVLGKALAALVWVTIATAAALILNRVFITNWVLAILFALLAALFAIGLGLLVGTFVKSPQQITMWSMGLVVLVILPVGLSMLEDILSAAFKSLLAWWPPMAMVRLFQFSLSSQTLTQSVLNSLWIALGATILVYAAIVWKLGRLDR